MKKQLQVLILIFLLVLSQVYISKNPSYNQIVVGLELKLKSNLTTIFDPNTWIFNQKVAQYSTKIIHTKDNKLYVEALALYLYRKENRKVINQRSKCIVIIDQTNTVGIFDIVDAMVIPTYSPPGEIKRIIWKVRCRLPNHYLPNLNRTKIAITDIKEYNELYNSGKYINNENLLSFHWVNFYDERAAKKKAVAHCVHMVYELKNRKLNQLRNWLKIQKNIGIDRVKFYFTRVEDSTKLQLKQEFGNYIDIIDYKLEFDSICKYPLLLNRTSKVDNITIKYLYENCHVFYNRYFDSSNIYIVVANEKVCTNDCLLGFKYQYEFTTNYDIDEVIFPRKFHSNDYSYFKSVANCNQSLNKFNFSYNIYDYAVNLTRKYGSNIGCFQFENVAFLTLPEVANQVKRFLEFNMSDKKLLLEDQSGLRLSLNIDSSHMNKILEMENFNNLIECYNRTITNGKKLDSIWNVPYAILINNRLGKSIFNTNLTLAYNQHYSEYLQRGAKKLLLPIDESYVVHYRNNFKYFFVNQRYSFSHFRFDVEFYQFLAYLNTF